MSGKPRKTLDDIDSDDDYIPRAAVVASASSPGASSSEVLTTTHLPASTAHLLSNGKSVCSAAAAAVDDFFGTTTAAAVAHKSGGGNRSAVRIDPTGQQSAYNGLAQASSPKGVAGGGNDFFDDFFGGGASTQPTTTRQQLNASPNTSNNNNTAQSSGSSSNNTNASRGGATNDDFLDISAKPSVQRHVTSDPLQYLEMATGGGTRLKPRAGLGDPSHPFISNNNNNTISGKASLGAASGISGSSSGVGSKFGSGADNGTAHILGNPFLLSRMTHYDVLGVTELLAEQEEISRAYKKKCLTLHPDRVVGREQTEAEKTYFKAVVKAHEILSDEESRREYDELLREHRASGGVGAPPVPGADGMGGTATAGFGGGGASSNVDQNVGGWDFLDEDTAGKGGLGDFAPKQQKTPNVVPPTGATGTEDPFFAVAPATKSSGFSFGSAKVTPLHADDGWGNFSGSSHPSSNFGANSTRPQPQPSGGGSSCLFGGQPRATIDDLFS